MTSLYAQYLAEKTDVQVLERDGEAFVTYEITGNQCYIKDIFVVKEKRSSKIAFDMCHEIAEIARKAGCLFVLGTVQKHYKNADEGIQFCLAMGMEKLFEDATTFYLIKDL